MWQRQKPAKAYQNITPPNDWRGYVIIIQGVPIAQRWATLQKHSIKERSEQNKGADKPPLCIYVPFGNSWHFAATPYLHKMLNRSQLYIKFRPHCIGVALQFSNAYILPRGFNP